MEWRNDPWPRTVGRVPDSTIVLGLDPSTTATGVAVLRISPRSVEVLVSRSLVPPRKAQRWERIRDTRHQLAVLLSGLSVPLDLITYEIPFVRGGPATAALHGAVGAYLTLSQLAGIPDVPVRPNAAKAAVSAFLWPTPGERQRKRSKTAVIEAVNARLGLALQPDEDAVADAIAVALAGYKYHTSRKPPPPLTPFQLALRRKAGLA